MQALIDFDGWRKWKDAAIANGLKDASNMKPGGAGKKAAGKKVTIEKKSSSTEQSSGKEDSPDAIVAAA
jgi:predicted transcriptional regulator